MGYLKRLFIVLLVCGYPYYLLWNSYSSGAEWGGRVIQTVLLLVIISYNIETVSVGKKFNKRIDEYRATRKKSCEICAHWHNNGESLYGSTGQSCSLKNGCVFKEKKKFWV